MIRETEVGPDGPALVPGELRGYRQFDLRPDGLYPLVHYETGPWDDLLTRAGCAAGGDHDAPAADCRCGLYAWYLPGSATVCLGPASAVVAARGRCILGDRGFRAASARVEALSLPSGVRWNPLASKRARRMLAERYPAVRVYKSSRRMLKDHPPHDVRSLGIDPPPDRSREYRAAAIVLSVVIVVLTSSLAMLPRFALARGLADWWPVMVLLAVLWQAGLAWLITRLVALQAPSTTGPRRPGPR